MKRFRLFLLLAVNLDGDAGGSLLGRELRGSAGRCESQRSERAELKGGGEQRLFFHEVDD